MYRPQCFFGSKKKCNHLHSLPEIENEQKGCQKNMLQTSFFFWGGGGRGVPSPYLYMYKQSVIQG